MDFLVTITTQVPQGTTEETVAEVRQREAAHSHDLAERREPAPFVAIRLMHLNCLLAFDGIITSRGGIPLIDQGVISGAIGCSGGTDSQDEVLSEAGAAVINQLPATNK
jgi:uncharacterized protein GlcG (DUF336 family)